MSTKSTIASAPDGSWWLQKELFDDTTLLVFTRPALTLTLTTNRLGAELTVELPADLLDKIAAIHRDKGFPHQSPN
jgi:hypothetical protein